MSATNPCVPCCGPNPQVVNVPGVAGTDGTDGTNGGNAYTTVTGGGLTVPGSVGGSVTFTVVSSAWVALGQIIVVAGPATFLVTALPTPTSITGTWQAYAGDVAATTIISAGAVVTPGGVQSSISRVISTAVDYAILTSDDVIQVTADNHTVTLPTAVGVNGKRYTVIQTAAFSSGTTIACTGGQTINGSATATLGAQYKYKTVVSNGSNWFIIANN